MQDSESGPAGAGRAGRASRHSAAARPGAQYGVRCPTRKPSPARTRPACPRPAGPLLLVIRVIVTGSVHRRAGPGHTGPGPGRQPGPASASVTVRVRACEGAARRDRARNHASEGRSSRPSGGRPGEMRSEPPPWLPVRSESARNSVTTISVTAGGPGPAAAGEAALALAPGGKNTIMYYYYYHLETPESLDMVYTWYIPGIYF